MSGEGVPEKLRGAGKISIRNFSEMEEENWRFESIADYDDSEGAIALSERLRGKPGGVGRRRQAQTSSGENWDDV